MATGSSKRSRPAYRVPQQSPLLYGEDHGDPVTVDPQRFAPEQRGGGWGPFADSFIKFNREALLALDLEVDLTPAGNGLSLRLVPGGRAGAIPLRSAQTGRVVGGFVVRPRFGWAGVGRVLAQTGWHAMPEFLEMPLVPGSGREIPPWVLAGPVLMRLEALIHRLKRGYQETEATRTAPRGTILWQRYMGESLVRGRWEQIPCRFWDLNTDPRLRGQLRWVLGRIRMDLLRVGARDSVAVSLAAFALELEQILGNVLPLIPRFDEMRQHLGSTRLMDDVFRRGVRAMSWVVEERGLGGGREMDGLAWSLPLEKLWEGYVESVVRREAAVTGGEVKVGRLGETTFPIRWSDSLHRSLGHLVPDMVVRRPGRRVQIVDAKYKAHLADLDAAGWKRFAEEARDAHRADLHQVLAYAALFDADEVTATLVYPLRWETYRALHQQGRDVATAELAHGGRSLRLELRGLPFGPQSAMTLAE
jgi:hypothetical protein